MKKIYQCSECGFLSTVTKLFIAVGAKVYCENCYEQTLTNPDLLHLTTNKSLRSNININLDNN